MTVLYLASQCKNPYTASFDNENSFTMNERKIATAPQLLSRPEHYRKPLFSLSFCHRRVAVHLREHICSFTVSSLFENTINTEGNKETRACKNGETHATKRNNCFLLRRAERFDSVIHTTRCNTSRSRSRQGN